MKKSVNALFEESFNVNWACEGLSDYQGKTYHYREIAQTIAKIHILYEKCGIQHGDKIAIVSRNQANWGIAFLATMTYGAVIVPILHEFKPGNIHHLVNHSEAKILFAGSNVWENLNEAEMPNLDMIVSLQDFTVISSHKEGLGSSMEEIVNDTYNERYPKGYSAEDIKYYEDQPEELALISYTSGTSGFSKGVMLPYRSIYSNVMFARWAEPHMNNKSKVVSMLPSAHKYGLMFEFLFEMTIGCHTYFLTRLPTPKIIMAAFAEIKPDIIISVPLVIEKIYKNMLQPFISKKRIKMLLNLPVIDQMIEKKILQSLVTAFGERFREVIIGGAAFNREAEAFLRRINFPFTVGYGMTECGPIITYASYDNTRLYSCGKAAPGMEIKIDSPNPREIPGEVLVRGDNVFLGYYKNPQATEESFDEKGWFRTGDMGVIDRDGYLYLKGRSKTMILGPSGQNIYPEEIESSINNLAYVNESLVIEDNGVLTALIYPDLELKEEEHLDDDKILAKIKEGIEILNLELPNYCKIMKVEIFPEEFEKTPKKSIKRYLYQR